jgi:hypothetical protein
LLLLGPCHGCAILDQVRDLRPARVPSEQQGGNEPDHVGFESHGEAAAQPIGVDDDTEPLVPLTRGQLWARWNALRGDPYALDEVDRRLAEGARPPCDPKALVSYRGTELRYHGSVLVSEPFRERLSRFETVAAEVAREVYGRAPTRVRHLGAYSCRTTRNRSWIVSEHALGNALDLLGFDFATARKDEPLPEGLPKSLKWGFQVRVAKHWSSTKGVGAVHARFLARLTERLGERDDIFRSMYGPGHGGHDDHLHLDVSPWRYVDL